MNKAMESGASLLELLLFVPLLFAVLFAGTDLALYCSERHQVQSELAILSLSELREREAFNLARNSKRLLMRFSEENGRLLSISSTEELSREEQRFNKEFLSKARAQTPHPWAKRRLHRLTTTFSPRFFYHERAALLFSMRRKRLGLLTEFTSSFAGLPEFVFVAEIIPE